MISDCYLNSTETIISLFKYWELIPACFLHQVLLSFIQWKADPQIEMVKSWWIFLNSEESEEKLLFSNTWTDVSNDVKNRCVLTDSSFFQKNWNVQNLQILEIWTFLPIWWSSEEKSNFLGHLLTQFLKTVNERANDLRWPQNPMLFSLVMNKTLTFVLPSWLFCQCGKNLETWTEERFCCSLAPKLKYFRKKA